MRLRAAALPLALLATHRPTPLLLQAQLVWLGHRPTGFRIYVRRRRQDGPLRYAQL